MNTTYDTREAQTPGPPAWWDEIELCHIAHPDQSVPEFQCGRPRPRDPGTGENAPLHGRYNGSAVCPTCSKPKCPRCVQLNEIRKNLERS